MSLRSFTYQGYNRAEEKEEHHWTDLLWNEDQHFVYDDPIDYEEELYYYQWVYIGCPYGYCNNMEEYHQMNILTLLRKFAIDTANEEARSRGW